MLDNNNITIENYSQIASFLALIPGAALAYDGSADTFYFNELAAQWFRAEYQGDPIKSSDVAIQATMINEQCSIQEEKTPWRRAWNGDNVQGFELALRAANQPPRFVLCNSSNIISSTGNSIPIAIVTMIDISSIRSDYEVLLNSKEQLSTIVDGMNAGIWHWNIQTGESHLNDRWARILGYSVQELAPITIETLSRFTHPDDMKETHRLLNLHIEGKSSHFSNVLRMQHKDGHWVWIQCRGRVYKWDTQGNPLWMAGTNLDISSDRAAEEDARSIQAYQHALIDSSSEVAIIATDMQGVVTVFNTGAEKLLGYSEAEVVGKLTPATFHLESEVVARGQELSKLKGYEVAGFDVFVHEANLGKSETRKWTYVCKSGEHRRISLSVSALRDEHKKVMGFLGLAVDETARFAAEEEAMLAAKRFAGAFSSTAVGMGLVSLEGGWMEVNDALCEMLGYSREELLKTDFQTLTYPDDLQNDLDLLGRLLADEIQNYEMQKRYYRKDGELIRAKLWVALVRKGNGEPLHFVSQIQNITEEYSARQALLSSEARLRGLFDLSPVGISLMDYKTGNQLEANTALVAPSGYTHDEFIKLNERELTPREYAPEINKAIEQLRATGRYAPFEMEYIRKDRSRYPVLVQGILMKETSGRSVVWTLVEDISERKRLDLIKNEFVSTVSHELRTPLTSISGALSLIVEGVLGEVNSEVQDMLRIAALSSKRLSALVNDLLDMDKLLAGKMKLSIEDIELLPLLEETIKSMEAFAHTHKVEITLVEDTPMQLRTDSTRFVQVLTNLLSNACKHSSEGAKVELQHIAGPEGSVIISVIDHGKGIPSEFRSRIFQKFAQADNSDSSTRKGTGLGLAICKELVERMGGVIGYESNENEGSHFWMRLPRAKSRVKPDSQLPRVLHVEDDVDLAKLIAVRVSDWARMDLAADLALANSMLRSNHYDLILLDLSLPDGSGETLWESLHLSQPDVPIVILSGHEVPRKLASNVAAVLIKDETTLEKVVRTMQHIFEMGEE